MGTIKTPEPLVRPYRYKPEVVVAARPIDTYVKPMQVQRGAPIGTTALESLANAFREVSPTLNQYFEHQEDKKRAAEMAKGEEEQKLTSIKTWADYTRAHPEHEKYSPWFKAGFEKQSAMAKGAEYQLFVQELRVKDPDMPTDPTLIPDYIQKKGAEWMKDNVTNISPEAVSDYLIPSMANTNSFYISKIGDEKLDQMVQEKQQNYQTSVRDSTIGWLEANKDLFTKGTPEEQERAVIQQAYAISTNANGVIIDGSNPTKINDSTIETLTSLMTEAADTDWNKATAIKKVLDNLTGKDGAKLSNIQKYRDAIKTSWDNAGNTAYNRTLQSRQVDKWAREDKSQEALDKYGQQVLVKPGANYEALIAKVGKEYGQDAADDFRTYVGNAFSLHRSYKAAAKADASGTGTSSLKQSLKFDLLATAEQRRLTYQEAEEAVKRKILTAEEATKAMRGGFVVSEKYRTDGTKIANMILGLTDKKKVPTVEQLDQRKEIRSSYLQARTQLEKEYAAKGLIPLPSEIEDFNDAWAANYKTKRSKEIQDEVAADKAIDKTTKATSQNKSASILGTLPKLTSTQLQQLINEDAEEKKKKGGHIKK